jgi:hypothetical protein
MGARTQIAMDRSAVAAGVLGGERVRFFRDGVQGPAWGDHLAIPSPILGRLTPGVASGVTVDTLAGPMTVGVLLAHDAGPGAPVIVSHHGNNERAFDLGRRAKNFLNRALLIPVPVPATVVLLRAPFHDGPLRAYTRAAGEVRTWMAMLAASVATVDAVLERHGSSDGRPTILVGLSLGGWVSNLHRAFHNNAGLYVPMLAGAHLGRQMVDSSYRRMVSRRASEAADDLRALLDFDQRFRAVTDRNLAPLLARYDQFARIEDQLGDYGDTPVAMLETGHVGAALRGSALRTHVLAQLTNVQQPAAQPRDL